MAAYESEFTEGGLCILMVVKPLLIYIIHINLIIKVAEEVKKLKINTYKVRLYLIV